MYSVMTPSSSVAFAALFFFCLLLLPAQHGGASRSHASYKLGSRQLFFKTSGRSSGNSQQASTATTCSSITAGQGNKQLPVVHPQSPCSPLHGLLPSLTAADVMRRRFSSQPSTVAAPSPAPLPAAITIPANGSLHPSSTLSGIVAYHVLVGYGTPAQQLPMFLDDTLGTSILRCKPCASGSDDCDPAFDTSRSSTFAHVPCDSPDCPTNCSAGGSVCPFLGMYVEGSFARDMLTLAPSSTVVHDFRFVCADVGLPPAPNFTEVGTLDLSRDHNSLPSRLSSTSLPFFSYCLPQSPNSQGFLSFGGDATVRDDDNRTVHAPLVSSTDPDLASMYFIDLVGMSLGGEDLPIPARTFSGSKGGTNLSLRTSITQLPPDAYTLLRDAFQKEMSQYNRSVPGFAGLDTCFNFTGLQELTIPLVWFKFSNGESLLIDGDQMLYYDEPAAGPFTMACLAFTYKDDVGNVTSAVIGGNTLASMEVIYDVAGGKVSFIPWSC